MIYRLIKNNKTIKHLVLHDGIGRVSCGFKSAMLLIKSDRIERVG